MRLELGASALLLGTLACTTPLPGSDGDGDGTDTETSEAETDGDSDSDPDTDGPECTASFECPEDYQCVAGECEAQDIGPCECAIGEVCVDEECIAVEGIPACNSLEIVDTEAFTLPGDEGALVIAEFDGSPGLDLVGVGIERAMTWSGGVVVESELSFPGGTSLQIAALHGNDDGYLDLAVTIPSVHILYHLAGDGAGGFAIEMQRNFGGNPVWDVARVRTAPDLDGMIAKVIPDDGNEHRMFFDAANSVQPEHVFDGYLERWVGDLDGDEVDELIVLRDTQASVFAFQGNSVVEVAQLPTTIEPLPTVEHCDGFAIGDLDGDDDNDIVCTVYGYADSKTLGVLVPLFNAGSFVFERGEPVIVEANGAAAKFFDLDGDASPELLLPGAVVDIGPGGSFDCTAAHELGFGEVGDLDGDGADELVGWVGPLFTAHIYDLSWE